MSRLRDDIAGKLANISKGYEVTSTFIKSINYQSGSYDLDAMKKLNEYSAENQIVSAPLQKEKEKVTKHSDLF